MTFIHDYLRQGDNFIDAGANIGLYTLLAASIIGPRGHIDAFEPAESTANRLIEQIELNKLKNTVVHRVAVSNLNHTVEFGFSAEDATAHIRRDTEIQGHGHLINSIRLDDHLHGNIYAMGKMDIEGAEFMALQGAKNMLANCNPPVWQLEMAGYSNCYGVTTNQVIEQLAQAGYDCAIYDPIKQSLYFTDQPWEYGVQNVLAIARPAREKVFQRLQSNIPA